MVNQTNERATKLGIFHWSVLAARHGHQHSPVVVKELNEYCDVIRVCPGDAVLPDSAPSLEAMRR